jgi:hypothetical protein
MLINATITVGNLIEIAMIAIGGLFFVWKISTKNDLLSLRLDHLQQEISSLKDIIVAQATQDLRIESLEKWRTSTDSRLADQGRRVDELRHGEGMVLPLHRSPYEK